MVEVPRTISEGPMREKGSGSRTMRTVGRAVGVGIDARAIED